MPYVLTGLALLIVWGIVTVVYQAPGWIHLLLTAGLALCIYGVVKPKSAGTK